MTQTARQEANTQQRIASDPAVSAFVSASAGSGKTKLLTDRLLRLMLGRADRPGTDPARIQCLTFTKAAAAEMSLRLQRVLGAWVTLDDAMLDVRLGELQVPAGREMRERARALFAQVLDLPGGMRIGTIHAFCQSLLRRFPLEARLSPHFRLLDDADMAVRLADAREALLEQAHTDHRQSALAAVTSILSLRQFGQAVDALRTDPARLHAASILSGDDLRRALCRVLGTPESEVLIMDAAVAMPDEAQFRGALLRVSQSGTPAKVEKANRLLAWLSCGAAERATNWHEWESEFFTKARKPSAMSGFVNDGLAKRHQDLGGIFACEQQRVAQVQDRRSALQSAHFSSHLVALAAPVVAAYRERNDGAALLDYQDLIRRTSSLLVDPGAAWVLYKLDGGIDHLLLDEVQDTAPEQWEIAGALASEFFAGAGARETEPSIFAVGDPKQSIYSFQGAAPDAFDHWQKTFRTRVEGAGRAWREVDLRVSFRSTDPVLRLVDAVFAPPLSAAGVSVAGQLTHLADREGHAGRIEIWPLAPVPDKLDAVPWQVPDRNLRQVSAPQRLADALADWIASQVDGTVSLDSRGRPMVAGDVLVLVRRRNEFQRLLTRALKVRGVPVAGLDRMVLTEQPAVADLLALCDTLLLPQDDLSLACVLTSPLGGLTDDSLLALASGRAGSLWDALRRRRDENPAWARAHRFIAALMARADHVSPYLLLSEALGPLGGRHRLFARLGAEAGEPIDELLNIARADAKTHAPSLQAFVHWLRQSGSEVKREAESAGGSVRIMTVHGAKGLQAPLVILPDTTSMPPEDSAVHWVHDAVVGHALPVWAGHKDMRCAVSGGLRDAARDRQLEEQNRLLYVALTRAEDRLLVCGWQTGRKMPELAWYEQVRAGFERLGASSAAFQVGPAPWEGETLHIESTQTAAPAAAVPKRLHALAVLPTWAGQAPDWTAGQVPTEPQRPQPLAPSRPDGIQWGEAPAGVSPLADIGTALHGKAAKRFRLGDVTHSLLQHLPQVPADRQAASVERFLANPSHGLDAAEAARLTTEVMAVVRHPALGALFGPGGRSETPIAGVVGDAMISGVVDRFVVLPDRVVVADYKTNRSRPRSVETVPPVYLQQMSAYRELLRQIYPTRDIRCILIWTIDACVMELPATVLDAHRPQARHRPDMAGALDTVFDRDQIDA